MNIKCFFRVLFSTLIHIEMDIFYWFVCFTYIRQLLQWNELYVYLYEDMVFLLFTAWSTFCLANFLNSEWNGCVRAPHDLSFEMSHFLMSNGCNAANFMPLSIAKKLLNVCGQKHLLVFERNRKNNEKKNYYLW